MTILVPAAKTAATNSGRPEQAEQDHEMTTEEFAAKVAYYRDLEERNGELTDEEFDALLELAPPLPPGPSPTLESLRRENIYPDRA
jgi:hypothetical protein